ncbi:uncharacterized protein [Euphorbia lathyris]|uniref:uncharacterized protein n=1 Tax=Euphorbia lathyris TaxID=212925 RepID=UPI003313F75E
MSEKPCGLVASANLTISSPNYFTFYTCEVKELLSQNEDFLHADSKLIGHRCGKVSHIVKTEPSSGSMFSNNVGAGLSNQKKESLNALLRQSVEMLTPEVDELLDPAKAMHRLQSQITRRKLSSDDTDEIANDGTSKESSNKRIKTLPSSSISISRTASPVSSGSCGEGSSSKCTDSECSHVAVPLKGKSNGVQKHLGQCSTTSLNPGGKFQCNNLGTAAGREGESHLGLDTSGDKGNGESDDDLQFLLVNDSSLVEEAVKKYSDQLFTTLGHMEKQLEELLDAVVSTCRPMSSNEKQHLKKLIQKLPPKNLNRVVEIVQRNKLAEAQCSDEIFVDLERQDHVTLWRLYYYTEAVEKARKLSFQGNRTMVP